MIRPKVIQRNSGSRLIGMPVRMSDGWRGKIESSGGGIVACLADGARPDAHWSGNYRIVGPSSITIKDSTATVIWKAKPARSAVDREQGHREQRRAAVVADLLRSWESVPD